MSQPILLVVTSDDHPNSHVGLCHPDGVPQDEGQLVMPSKAQLWLWNCWDDLWLRAAKLKRELDIPLYWLHNGDGCDDNTHSKHGLMSLNKAIITEQAIKVKQRGLDVADKMFYVRGTEAHVGQGGELEELVARGCKAEPDPDPGMGHMKSRWYWRIKLSDVLIFARHKPDSNTMRFWTRGGGANRSAVQLELACSRLGWERPTAAYFGHVHHVEASGENNPIKVFFCPPFCLTSGWAASMGYYPEPVGARLAICDEGSFLPLPVEDWLYRPSLHTESEPWNQSPQRKSSRPLKRLWRTLRGITKVSSLTGPKE